LRAVDTTAKLLTLVASGLERSLASMTGKAFSVSPTPHSEPVEMQDALLWQQTLSISAEPVLWLSAPRDLWTAAGQMTLSAVGIDDPSDDDSRSTWQEIVGQAVGALAGSLTAEVQQEVTAGSGEEVLAEPWQLDWMTLQIRCEDSVWFVKFAWAKALPAIFERQQPAPEQKAAVAGVANFSKTFDLLLDVALPVAVSFGKTALQIREVLKLNTGSIVELNRFVADPVDVIVNDCVIARGEVVVVDGNYGVRITQLASREDRLRMGMAETPARMAVAK